MSAIVGREGVSAAAAGENEYQSCPRTVAAEAGQVHQVDVLYVGALAQVRNQAAEGGRFDFSAIGLGDGISHGASQ